MKAKQFNPSAAHAVRALQAWQILVGKAMNRQTVTYLDLSRLMYGRDAAGVIAQVLGHIAYWCEDRSLPRLTAIVVAKGRGTPGHGIPLDPAKIDAEREDVYHMDWYGLLQPTEGELAAAYAARHGNSN